MFEVSLKINTRVKLTGNQHERDELKPWSPETIVDL